MQTLRPAESYAEALARIAALPAQDSEPIDPASRLRILAHGRKVERAIVFLHGYANSPQQFHQLGAMFYKMGYNVCIPRAPHHGLANRLTREHSRLTAAKLLALTAEAVGIAQGLGSRVTVAGLSMGGVMAAWAGQECADVDRAVLIAPAFGFRVVPAALTPGLAGLAPALPNIFIRWDDRLKAGGGGPTHTYPRYSIRALGQILRLGAAVRARARWVAPAARSIVVVTNANDRAVDNGAAARMVNIWRASGAKNLSRYEFPAHLQLPHDLIDPANAEQRTDIVYRVLVGLITAG